MLDYYNQQLFVPQVDEHDNIVGKVERWDAHKKGVLHRAFDVAVFYENKIICQIRKHPVYNGVLDFTATSHPYYHGEVLQEMIDGVYATLAREWNIGKEQLVNLPESLGKIYWKANDGTYTEHEICHFFVTTVDSLPQVNFDYAYGYALLSPAELKSGKIPSAQAMAPWVKEALNKNLL